MLHFSPQWKNYSWIIISVIKLQFHGEPDHVNMPTVKEEWQVALDFLGLQLICFGVFACFEAFGNILWLVTGRLNFFQESVTDLKGPTLWYQFILAQ